MSDLLRKLPLDPRVTVRTTCRACGSADLDFLYSLGVQYVSDFPDRATRYDDPTCGVKCPIDLMLCKGCTMVQLAHTAPQELLYTRKYWYKSGTTQTMCEALRDVTAAVERTVDLQPGDVVLDIGSNDGTLLRSYSAPGIVRVGVEPASNLRIEGEVGVDFLIDDFWGTDRALTRYGSLLDEKKAKAITAAGMLYDLEEPNIFVADVAKALAPDGVFVAQLMCLKNMMDSHDVGNFAHEHLEYYSLRSLRTLLDKHGLGIFDVETNKVNGGSYRLFVCHNGVSESEINIREGAAERIIRAFGAEYGLDDVERHREWFRKLEVNKGKVLSFLQLARSAGKRTWIYGASTKGNVILQWCGIDGSLIDAAADKSEEKWGKWTVGANIPIRSEDEFRRAAPDYALVLPYAFRSEFIEREKVWLQQGGKFLFPLPSPELVYVQDGKTTIEAL